MTIKRQHNKLVMVPCKKFVAYIMEFFIPFHSTCVTLCQFFSIASPVLFNRNNKLWNERKKISYIYGCFSESRYIKGGRKLRR